VLLVLDVFAVDEGDLTEQEGLGEEAVGQEVRGVDGVGVGELQEF
jgi:hypothetical protein